VAPGDDHVPPIFISHVPTLLGDVEARGAELATWARALPRPRSVLVVSSRWQAEALSRGTTAGRPALLHEADEPEGSQATRWSASGAPDLAYDLHQLLPVEREPGRAWDAGVWMPLSAMFPAADVPVLQVSLVLGATPRSLFAIGRKLGVLASRGVLLVGSGAITHNLAALDPRPDAPAVGWAREFDSWIANLVADAEHEDLFQWRTKAPNARLAQPSGPHLDPLFVVAGAASLYEHSVGFPLRGFDHGTVSRRAIQFGR